MIQLVDLVYRPILAHQVCMYSVQLALAACRAGFKQYVGGGVELP